MATASDHQPSRIIERRNRTVAFPNMDPDARAAFIRMVAASMLKWAVAEQDREQDGEITDTESSAARSAPVTGTRRRRA